MSVDKPTPEQLRYWERLLVGDGLGMWVGTTSKLTYHNNCPIPVSELNERQSVGCNYKLEGQKASCVPYANKLRTGWHHSDALKEGMKGNKRHLGCKHTDASKAKMSLAKKGKTFTQEHKDKIAASLVGRPVSNATKAKISATQKELHPPMPVLCGHDSPHVAHGLCSSCYNKQRRSK